MDRRRRCCADQNAHLPGNQKRFINPNIGSQLLRFASQRSVSNLEVAHRIWDVLLEQGSRASRVAMRGYLIALQRRDPDNPRMAEVLSNFLIRSHFSFQFDADHLLGMQQWHSSPVCYQSFPFRTKADLAMWICHCKGSPTACSGRPWLSVHSWVCTG